MLLLCNSKKGFLQIIELILYNNFYLIIGSYLDVYYLIKLFIKKYIFYKQIGKNNNKTNLLNLFTNDNILLVKKILLI